MNEKLPYHKPTEQDPAVTRRRAAQRTIWIGLLILGVSALLVFSPLLLGGGGPAKYIVAFGLIGGCWGASCILLAAWDWIRR